MARYQDTRELEIIAHYMNDHYDDHHVGGDYDQMFREVTIALAAGILKLGPQAGEIQNEVQKAAQARARKNAARRERHAALTSLGLKRVRGAQGGVYYE